MKTMVGESEARFGCSEVKLCAVDPGREFWTYVVVFTSDHTSLVTRTENRVQKAVLPFVVYFDAFVVSPWAFTDGPL